MRRFELVDGTSNKFWEIDVEGEAYTVRYGRIGTDGQTKTKTFDSEVEAQKAADKAIGQKVKKGYAQVGSPTAATAATVPTPPAKAVAPPEASKPEPTAAATKPPSVGLHEDELPSAVARAGAWTELLPPGEGRDYVGMPSTGNWVWNGPWGLSLRGKTVFRLNLADASFERVAELPLDDRGYRSLAIDSAGERWAVSDGKAVWIDGVAREMVITEITFGADGSLWGFVGQSLVRLNAQGEETWRGAMKLNRLGMDGDRFVLAGYHVVIIGDAQGTLHQLETEFGSPNAILVGHGLALMFTREPPQVAVWDLDARTERIFDLPEDYYYQSMAISSDRQLLWSTGSLDLQSGELEEHQVPSLFAPSYASIGSIGAEGLALSPDETELWDYVEDASAVRRLRRATREERSSRPVSDPSLVYDLSVAGDGRVAVAYADFAWQVLSPAGEVLFRREGIVQSNAVDFSPDGTRLAVIERTEKECFVRMVETRTFEALVERKMEADTLAFDRSGERLLVGTGNSLYLVSAQTLESQHRLVYKGSLRGAHWSEGRIVAHDFDGRACVFDDPGPGPAQKNPPKQKPTVALPRADVHTGLGVMVEVVGDRIAAFGWDKIHLLDAASKKLVEKQPVDGFGSRHGRVYAKSEKDGATLWRFGEAEPFARLPAMPRYIDATPDGRRVAAVMHKGVLLWTEEGERTPTRERATPADASTPDGPLPGFTSDTLGFAVHGCMVTTKPDGAAQLARALARAAHERGWTGLVAPPDGDLSETNALREDDDVCLVVGIQVVQAECGADQGERGEPANFTAKDAEAARAAWQAIAGDVRALVASESPAARWEHDDRLYLVACGPLSSAEVKVSKRSLAKVCWEEGSCIQEFEPGKRGRHAVTCWYD